MIDKKDVLGYLYVLNDQSVWSQLTAGEQSYGISHVTGCFTRLMDSLIECDPYLYNKIKDREKLNCEFDWENPNSEIINPLLAPATKEVALLLFERYRTANVSTKIKKQFIDKLDIEFAKILRK